MPPATTSPSGPAKFPAGTPPKPEGDNRAPTSTTSTAEARTKVCVFQQCGILTSVDSDESVQPPFQLRSSKWCSVSSLTIIEYSSD